MNCCRFWTKISGCLFFTNIDELIGIPEFFWITFHGFFFIFPLTRNGFSLTARIQLENFVINLPPPLVNYLNPQPCLLPKKNGHCSYLINMFFTKNSPHLLSYYMKKKIHFRICHYFHHIQPILNSPPSTKKITEIHLKTQQHISKTTYEGKFPSYKPSYLLLSRYSNKE